MTEPQTPTGKRLGGAAIIEEEPWLLDDILAIEAEAARQERERLRVEFAELRIISIWLDSATAVLWDDVVALLAEEPAETP